MPHCTGSRKKPPVTWTEERAWTTGPPRFLGACPTCCGSYAMRLDGTVWTHDADRGPTQREARLTNEVRVLREENAKLRSRLSIAGLLEPTD